MIEYEREILYSIGHVPPPPPSPFGSVLVASGGL